MKTAKWEASTGALMALLATRSFVWADLYTITLVGGEVLRYAKGDTDWVVEGNVWVHGGPAVEHPDRKPLMHQKIGTDVDTWQFNLMPRPFDLITGQPYPDMIGNVPILAAVQAKVLRGAVVTVDRAFLPSWPPFPRPIALTPTGTVNVFTGRVAEQNGDRSSINISLNSHLELLNLNMPRNLYQAGCGHVLFDGGCTLRSALYATGFNLAAGSTQSTLVVEGSPPTGFGTYALGRIAFTGGLNAGYSRAVRTMTVVGTTLQLRLVAPMSFPVSVGDALTAWPGCDKQLTTCQSVGNQLNFGGQPYIPSPELAV